MGARGRRRAMVGFLILVAFVAGACYTRHVPLDDAQALPTRSATPLPMTVGIRVSPSQALNAQRIHPTVVVEQVAFELDRRRVFERVVFPHGALGGVEPDLEIEILARGRFGHGPWEVEQRTSRTRRLQSTWLQVSEGALRDWSEVTSGEAAERLAEAIAADPALRRRTGIIDRISLR